MILHSPHTAPFLHSQAVTYTSSAVIEDGGALWVVGGQAKDGISQSSTQIVRPGQPTVRGPDMTEVAMSHCSATLADNTVMVTGGGRRSDAITGSARAEVYSFTSEQWTRRADMNQRRMSHSCSAVWLDSSGDPLTGVIDPTLTNSSVLSVVVAGGESLLVLYFLYFWQLALNGTGSEGLEITYIHFHLPCLHIYPLIPYLKVLVHFLKKGGISKLSRRFT